MTADEIRKIENSQLLDMTFFMLREIAALSEERNQICRDIHGELKTYSAQLAEHNELTRRNLMLDGDGQPIVLSDIAYRLGMLEKFARGEI